MIYLIIQLPHLLICYLVFYYGICGMSTYSLRAIRHPFLAFPAKLSTHARLDL